MSATGDPDPNTGNVCQAVAPAASPRDRGDHETPGLTRSPLNPSSLARALLRRWDSVHPGAGIIPWRAARIYFGGSLLQKVPAADVHLSLPKMPWSSHLFRPPQKFIMGGDWDLGCIPFAAKPVYLEMRDLLLSGLPYRQTNAYATRMADLSADAPRKHRGKALDSLEEIDRYFERYLWIADSMAHQGYRSNFDLGCPDKAEIGVVVRRDGRLAHFQTGGHRLAIASIIGLSEIVVEVRMVHLNWMLEALANERGQFRLFPPRLGSVAPAPAGRSRAATGSPRLTDISVGD